MMFHMKSIHAVVHSAGAWCTTKLPPVHHLYNMTQSPRHNGTQWYTLQIKYWLVCLSHSCTDVTDPQFCLFCVHHVCDTPIMKLTTDLSSTPQVYFLWFATVTLSKNCPVLICFTVCKYCNLHLSVWRFPSHHPETKVEHEGRRLPIFHRVQH